MNKQTNYLNFLGGILQNYFKMAIISLNNIEINPYNYFKIRLTKCINIDKPKPITVGILKVYQGCFRSNRCITDQIIIIK